jgi:hypothetical protein
MYKELIVIMGGKELPLEFVNEVIESRKIARVREGVPEPGLRLTGKKGDSIVGLTISCHIGKIHVFLNIIGPVDDHAEGRIGIVELLGFWDLESGPPARLRGTIQLGGMIEGRYREGQH